MWAKAQETNCALFFGAVVVGFWGTCASNIRDVRSLRGRDDGVVECKMFAPTAD